MEICEQSLNAWEQDNIEILTSKEMGAWLARRDKNREKSGKYYDLDKMPDPECTVKFRYEDLHINSCGKCRHLIFKDYKHNEGFCDLVRINRCFTDRCVHEEEIS